MAENQNPEEEPIIIKKIIKKGGHGGHHGGAWKVAYADFVTAMMCLFLLLWLLNVDPSVKKTISEFFRQQPINGGPLQGNIFVFGGAKSPADPGKFEGGSSFLAFERKALTEANKKEIAKMMKVDMKKNLEVNAEDELFENIEFNVTEDGILIEIKDREDFEIFKVGSASITTQANSLIDKLAVILRKKAAPIIVSGHTDGARFGYGNYDNWDLSADRANSLRKRLIYGGLGKDRIVRVAGYASTQLKYPGDLEYAGNRRITILLLQKDKIDSVKPKYLDLDHEFANIPPERKIEAKIKQKGNQHQVLHSMHEAAGKRYKNVTLDDLRRKKGREAYRLAHPVAPEASGGH